METKAVLKRTAIDANIEDFKFRARIKVYSDINDLLVMNSRGEHFEDSIFGLWITGGKDEQSNLMFDINVFFLFVFTSINLSNSAGIFFIYY